MFFLLVPSFGAGNHLKVELMLTSLSTTTREPARLTFFRVR